MLEHKHLNKYKFTIVWTCVHVAWTHEATTSSCSAKTLWPSKIWSLH